MLAKLGDKITINEIKSVKVLKHPIEGTIVGIDDTPGNDTPYLVSFDRTQLDEALGFPYTESNVVNKIAFSLCSQVLEGIDMKNPPLVVWVNLQDIV